MKSLLITQCLQNDFVKPVPSGHSLPNLLHIGHEESLRLIGEDALNGPVGIFMKWANDAGNVDVIHIRDWHDPDNAAHRKHLHQFGNHCLQNTPGADFVFDLDKIYKSTVINSSTLNDFDGTGLDKALLPYSKERMHVGLIGVWTEAKILFLAYELSTRYPNFEIAVCSALTASSSRSQHFLALKQLQRIIGVGVIDSIGEFVEFLGGRCPMIGSRQLSKDLVISQETCFTLSDQDENLVRYLFRDCKSVHLVMLDGGFSGNLVAGAISVDMHGREQAKHVIKIGNAKSMARERIAFEQIEMVLGNSAPAIAAYADYDGRGAIKYRYASVSDGRVSTLQKCVMGGENTDKISLYLTEVFVNQLGRLYRAAVDDKCDLLEYYAFKPEWSCSVKSKIESLVGICGDDEFIVLPGNVKVNNLFKFYRDDLGKSRGFFGDFPFSFVHGDLNGANIVIDSNKNVWIIDFYHTHFGHVLKDFAKLENDLLYIYTPVDSDEDLLNAYQYADFLLTQPDPFDLPQHLPDSFRKTPFERSYAILRCIRVLAREHIRSHHRHRVIQWQLPQLRYAVHTLGFDESSSRQKLWALYMAGHLSARIKHEIIGKVHSC